jgi:hypothetical protein
MAIEKLEKITAPNKATISQQMNLLNDTKEMVKSKLQFDGNFRNPKDNKYGIVNPNPTVKCQCSLICRKRVSIENAFFPDYSAFTYGILHSIYYTDVQKENTSERGLMAYEGSIILPSCIWGDRGWLM